ncbi:LysR family transcriptional regulator [Rhizobium hainanense]|uniref:HTH-type transcriptional regulator TtuA n=1 Tax=Rhizobium hainanense TaxID=52131 RepID=A0A1C3W8D8_9HYPH|nr:LysR family transcriptional regulator [Rhizobium hainanense]SCB36467.1 DNA-binding transcriptional regulator, LysR family [Rhizobium hainanense]
MDSRHLHHFVALAETLHFGRAAARMNMSQPPFSRQISSIEKSLGVKLFERNSRNVTLTTAGEHFLHDSKAILAQFDAACRDVQLVANGMKGELKLGFMMHVANRVVPTLVRLYSEQRPDVRLILEERTPVDINEMLLEGALDAAITFAPLSAQHLRTISLTTDRLRLIVSAEHRLAGVESIRPSDLAGESLIAAPSHVAPTLRDAITGYCAAGGVPARFVLEPWLQHTIVRLVEEGLGIALIPEALCSETGPKVVSKPIVDSPEFEVALCAPLASRNPTVATLFDIAKAKRALFERR